MIVSATTNDIALLFVKKPEGQWWRHRYGDEPFYPQAVALDIRVLALVNLGCWMAPCPFRCSGAQLLCKDARRFFCVDCLNHEVGGAWVDVDWPDGAFVAMVEQILSARPLIESRNWWPNESLGYLVAENADRGGLVDLETGEVAGDVGREHHARLGYDQRKIAAPAGERRLSYDPRALGPPLTALNAGGG